MIMLKKILVFCIISIMLSSCGSKEQAEHMDLGIRYFKVLVDNVWKSCNVDNEQRKIFISEVSDPKLIVDVDYSLDEGCFLTPNPESLLGNWKSNEKIVLSNGHENIVYSILVSDYVDNVVTVSNHKRQRLCFGIDAERLWYWRSGPGMPEKLANLGVGELKSSYVRVAINCAYEREEGVKKEAEYDRILEMMINMKKINPDIMFFASPRPLEEAYTKDERETMWNGKVPWSPYPTWVYPTALNTTTGKYYLVDSKFSMENLIRYYSDYIKFMHDKGIKITYLDATNEHNIITPSRNKQLYLGIKSQIGPDVYMPEMIVPSTWSTQQGIDWLKSVKDDESDYFTIAATHNTDPTGSAVEFVETAKSLGKGVMNSELHDWIGIETIDEVLKSKIFWEHLNAGFEYIDSWLFYGPYEGKDHTMIWSNATDIKKSAKYEIYKQVVNNSNGGNCYLMDNIEDGKTITVAMQKNDDLSVWVLNYGQDTYYEQKFLIDSRNISGDVSCTIWNRETNKSGDTFVIPATDKDSFIYDIKPETLYFFKVKLTSAQ